MLIDSKTRAIIDANRSWCSIFGHIPNFQQINQPRGFFFPELVSIFKSSVRTEEIINKKGQDNFPRIQALLFIISNHLLLFGTMKKRLKGIYLLLSSLFIAVLHVPLAFAKPILEAGRILPRAVVAETPSP